MLTLTLLETVQLIRFYYLFYNWLSDFKIISLKYIFKKNVIFLIFALLQNIKYYKMEGVSTNNFLSLINLNIYN